MGIFSRRTALRRTAAETTMFHHVLYGVVSICMVILICAGIWYVSRLPFFTIQEIQIEGGETIPHADIRTMAENLLYGNYFFLIPHRFVYLYPREKIETLIEEVPRIRSVAVRRVERTNLHISFEEYVPYALWCQNTDETSPCYFIDEGGYAFAPAPHLRGGAFTRHVIEGVDALGEGQVFDAIHLQGTTAFMSGIESELGLRVKTITHTEADDIVYHINGGGDILAPKDEDVQVLFQNLKSILESKEFKHLTPGHFKYIDLRFGNKIFVNEDLNDEVATTTATSTADQAE